MLIELIQSDKCKIYGDTYFPELIYNNYEDLDFDLPETPMHKENNNQLEQSNGTLDSRISSAKERSENPIISQPEKGLIK